MIIQKTLFFSPEECNQPTFGITLRAGDEDNLYCSPHRVLSSIFSYANIEMLPFKIINEERVYCHLDEATGDSKEYWFRRWCYRKLFDGIIGIDNIEVSVYVKSVIDSLQSRFDQYESCED